ncbi:MAG: hypothetical protein K0R99_1388 [Microbacterium sp.]|jgi:hypothetical protein|nr:hypothetical protein [Microbacterium sp.]MDF2559942.1 hypothetical protein [Microbacterium sp.]
MTPRNGCSKGIQTLRRVMRDVPVQRALHVLVGNTQLISLV